MLFFYKSWIKKTMKMLYFTGMKFRVLISQKHMVDLIGRDTLLPLK